MEVDFILTVDGGGTKTDATLRRPDGQILAQARSGPCNLFQDPQGGLTAIAQAWRSCCTLEGLDADAVAPRTCLSAGLAGVNAPGADARFHAHFARFARRRLSSDGYATLAGAFPAGPGALLAIGTGTVACAFDTAGRFRQTGGWGFPVGDQGGGAWLGLNLVSRFLLHRDSAEPDPASACLWEALTKVIGDSRADILGWLRGAPPARFAELARLVTDSATPAAIALRAQAAGHLEHLVRSLALAPDTPLALTGGLAGVFHDTLTEALAPRPVRPITTAALDGAFVIALGQRPDEFPG